ncbi:cell wall hydrolase [Alterisphingorhabdus coralli]|uniref:Cell wall hydrolase n=1 Tax=Alterisphingorhabdus coralli TaxID=3071408 RepID=A0AA97I0Q5_9SPHN|nr:cell wall hydrolase [Parasphingorhabdus sp. SCSIO 66989]WOE74583.1 cell wall hydrolase [Parasphingorhabdus sp. SCSIO 66989]
MGHHSAHQPKRRAASRKRLRRRTPLREALRRKFSLREKLLSGALFVLSALSITQIGTAQSENFSNDIPTYDDARNLWSERSADNFPGSAFYYLAEDDAWNAAGGASLAGSAFPPGAVSTAGSLGITTPAKAFALTGTSRDRYRALQCLTTAIYYEAALEPDAGQRAVAQVILNRVRHPSYPRSVCGVVYQGSERNTGCQFTFSCDGSMARRPDRYHWTRARRVASDMLGGAVFVPAGLATHYHTTEVSPYWAPSLNFLGTIGAHRFYSWKGSAGRADAFSGLYSGHEPTPGPKPKRAIATKMDVTDPIALARAYEAAIAQSNQAAEDIAAKNAAVGTSTARAKAIVPAIQSPDYSAQAIAKGGDANYRAQNLPGASNVRPEYQDSGKWIAQPGKKHRE